MSRQAALNVPQSLLFSISLVAVGHKSISLQVQSGKAVNVVVEGKQVKIKSKQTVNVRLKDKH